jgi:hypothetical protein
MIAPLAKFIDWYALQVAAMLVIPWVLGHLPRLTCCPSAYFNFSRMIWPRDWLSFSWSAATSLMLPR